MLGQGVLGISVTYLIGLLMVALVFIFGKMWDRKYPSEFKKSGWSSGNIAKIAVLVAVAAAGGFISIPGPAASIKLDSTAGYFASLMFGWQIGSIVAAFGTFFANLMSGFSGWAAMVPYYMMNMALAALAFGYVSKRYNLIAGMIVGTIVNTLCILPWYLMLGWGIIVPILVPQIVGSFANCFLASVAYKAITAASKRKKNVDIDDDESDGQNTTVSQ
ncbi:MAG: ECF transporter S component [Bacillota bacterium]|jgi:uncharacterized membrane protein